MIYDGQVIKGIIHVCLCMIYMGYDDIWIWWSYHLYEGSMYVYAWYLWDIVINDGHIVYVMVYVMGSSCLWDHPHMPMHDGKMGERHRWGDQNIMIYDGHIIYMMRSSYLWDHPWLCMMGGSHSRKGLNMMNNDMSFIFRLFHFHRVLLKCGKNICYKINHAKVNKRYIQLFLVV